MGSATGRSEAGTPRDSNVTSHEKLHPASNDAARSSTYEAGRRKNDLSSHRYTASAPRRNCDLTAIRAVTRRAATTAPGCTTAAGPPVRKPAKWERSALIKRPPVLRAVPVERRVLQVFRIRDPN